jgi:hypothetical protein
MCGSDTQALDHPLGTAIGPHGPGAPLGLLPKINEEYFQATGRRVIEDFPEWEPCHNAILSAGNPDMQVTRFADARRYDAPKHFDMRSLRLQGFDASASKLVRL